MTPPEPAGTGIGAAAPVASTVGVAAPDAATATPGAPAAPAFTMLGDSSSPVCVDGVCELPQR